MTPPSRQGDDNDINWHPEALNWQHEALRGLKDDILAQISGKHERQKERVDECVRDIEMIRDRCDQQIKDFRNEQMTHYVSEKTMNAKLELVYEKQRIPALLIYGFCALILLAVVGTWIKMGGLHG